MSQPTTRRSLTTAVVLLAASAAIDSAALRAQPAASDTVVVFAAASLKTALDVIARQWTAATGHKVVLSYAASGALVRQIEAGAPADIYASADQRWMDYAVEKNLVVAASRKALLSNTLVLIAAKDDPIALPITARMKLADAIGDGRLAIGIPASVPAGAYAEAALKSLEIWDEVKSKTVGAESVRAALAFVARREARLGIVYGTDARSEPGVRVIGTFPAASHPPIAYPFAMTAGAKSPNAAAFLAYLSGMPARAVFEAEGFIVLP